MFYLTDSPVRARVIFSKNRTIRISTRWQEIVSYVFVNSHIQLNLISSSVSNARNDSYYSHSAYLDIFRGCARVQLALKGRWFAVRYSSRGKYAYRAHIELSKLDLHGSIPHRARITNRNNTVLMRARTGPRETCETGKFWEKKPARGKDRSKYRGGKIVPIFGISVQRGFYSKNYYIVEINI